MSCKIRNKKELGEAGLSPVYKIIYTKVLNTTQLHQVELLLVNLIFRSSLNFVAVLFRTSWYKQCITDRQNKTMSALCF